MPANRFFYENEITLENAIILRDLEHHHLSHVMRISVGESVELVNGKGVFAEAIVKKIEKKETHLKIVHLHKQLRPTHQKILAIPYMRASKLEWIVEKGTEIGADGFWIYPAKFSEKADLSPNQQERLYSLAISALKQSGRLFLPSFEWRSSFKEIFSFQGTILYGDVREDAPLLSTFTFETSTLFITGPEKGFFEKETELLDQQAQRTRLSPFILRAETAPIVAISILQSK